MSPVCLSQLDRTVTTGDSAPTRRVRPTWRIVVVDETVKQRVGAACASASPVSSSGPSGSRRTIAGEGWRRCIYSPRRVVQSRSAQTALSWDQVLERMRLDDHDKDIGAVRGVMACRSVHRLAVRCASSRSPAAARGHGEQAHEPRRPARASTALWPVLWPHGTNRRLPG